MKGNWEGSAEEIQRERGRMGVQRKRLEYKEAADGTPRGKGRGGMGAVTSRVEIKMN